MAEQIKTIPYSHTLKDSHRDFLRRLSAQIDKAMLEAEAKKQGIISAMNIYVDQVIQEEGLPQTIGGYKLTQGCSILEGQVKE